jgi:hypothetical protein
LPLITHAPLLTHSHLLARLGFTFPTIAKSDLVKKLVELGVDVKQCLIMPKLVKVAMFGIAADGSSEFYHQYDKTVT